MTLNEAFSLKDTLFAQEIDGEMILFDSVSENYFSLNEMGVTIWYLMQKHNNFKDIYSDLLEQYEVEEEILYGDLLNFTKTLIENGLIDIH